MFLSNWLYCLFVCMTWLFKSEMEFCTDWEFSSLVSVPTSFLLGSREEINLSSGYSVESLWIPASSSWITFVFLRSGSVLELASRGSLGAEGISGSFTLVVRVFSEMAVSAKVSFIFELGKRPI